MDKQKEIRAVSLENVSTNDTAFTLEGYIAKYNSRSQYLGFYEELLPGCFDESLATADNIYCLFNHDDDKLLGSTRNGTLQLTSDEVGLRFKLSINPAISYAKDCYELVKSGECRGCSFGFIAENDKWIQTEDGDDLRLVERARLLEVTVTPFPAYLDSEVSCRSYDNFKAEQSEQQKLAEEKAKAEELRAQEAQQQLELAKRKLSLELELY